MRSAGAPAGRADTPRRPRTAAARRRRGSGCAGRRPAASPAASCAAGTGRPTSGSPARRPGRSAMRSRSTCSGPSKLQPTISCRPWAVRASAARRRSRWMSVSRPEAPWREGSVAGRSASAPSRATSSMRSASRVTSERRKAGTTTSRPSGASLGLNSRAVRISAQRSRGTSTPSRLVTRASRSTTVLSGGPSPPTSIVPGSMRAPQSSIISRVAIAWASIACSG